MPSYFPLFVNLSCKKILVFGAGHIAARRVAALLRYGAAVTVIAPQILEDISKGLEDLLKDMEGISKGILPLEDIHKREQGRPRQLFLEQRAYRPGEIPKEGVDYVLAATNNKKTNTMICQECRQKGILVNNATDSSQCDFYFPALVERDDLVIGVTSTDGDHKKVAQFSESLRMEKQGRCPMKNTEGPMRFRESLRMEKQGRCPIKNTEDPMRFRDSPCMEKQDGAGL